MPDFRKAAADDSDRKWTIGLPKEYFEESSDPAAIKPVLEAIEFYKSQGIRIQGYLFAVYGVRSSDLLH